MVCYTTAYGGRRRRTSLTCKDYQKSGVSEYWIIDPERTVVQQYVFAASGFRGAGEYAERVALRAAQERSEPCRPIVSVFRQSQMEDRKLVPSKYVFFQHRPMWGIAQVQIEDGGIFGPQQWLSISDISPVDPEHRPARIRPDQSLEEYRPVPWDTPADQLAEADVAVFSNSKNHFLRLAAYWLQVENRQGQLDSLPVLQLRHQTSLVEYLSRSDAPRRMLIADEVGLGKTVEIGILLERLKAANPNLRVLYVTPGGLVTNVIDEFKNMGLDEFCVFANRTLDEEKYPLARLGRERHDGCVVASLHRLGWSTNPERQLRDTKWDVVVADECHRLRMYGTGDTQNSQKWYRLFERIIRHHLAPRGRVYFLSGTPHQGNRDVFLNLISLMLGLGRGVSQDEQQRKLSGRIVYRIKEEVYDWDNNPVFPRRDVKSPHYAENPPEYNTLLSDIAGFFDWITHNDRRSDRKRAIGFVKSHALQYAASSPKAGFAFLLRRCLRYFADDISIKKLLEWASLLRPYRQRPAQQRPDRLLEELRESVRDRREDDDVDYDLDDRVGPAGNDRFRHEEKKRLLELLTKYASFMLSSQAMAKFKVLTQLLSKVDEPFVVFAQSVDTVYEIKRHVEDLGIPCSIIVGGQDPSERRKAMNDFTGPGRLGCRVLVSSAAGGEGINLQVSRHLIHFDLPWNPMVLEQRIGRVHRIGTIDRVVVDTILLQNSREADIYERLIARLSTIVHDLTDSETKQEEYFRRIMAGIPLEKLRELFSGEVSNDEAIGEAVEAGKQHVEQVDVELRRNRVNQLPDEKGRANMQHLIELLMEPGLITKGESCVYYNKVVYDSNTDSFRATEANAICYQIEHGQGHHHHSWVVFDREAAARSPSVSRDNSGGINHPIIAEALRSLRTVENLESMQRLVFGVGTWDKDYHVYFSYRAEEPVVLLSYLTAYLRDEHFFDHELGLFTLSPSKPLRVPIEKDLIEEIIWSNIRKDEEIPSNLIDGLLSQTEFLEKVSSQDVRIRKELCNEVKDEQGNWCGAVWPLGITILFPAESGAPRLPANR